MTISDLSPGPWKDIGDIQLANSDAGLDDFTATRLNSFRTVILRGIYAGRLFVTSERLSGRRRMYTIRIAGDSGSIDVLGSFMQYATMDHAKAAARRYAERMTAPGVTAARHYSFD